MTAKKQRKKRIVRAARTATAGSVVNGKVGNTDAITLIRDVRALAERAGGYENLKDLVDALVG